MRPFTPPALLLLSAAALLALAGHKGLEKNVYAAGSVALIAADVQPRLSAAQNKNLNTSVCPAPRRVRHRAKKKIERAPELASSFVPPAPEPAPAPPPTPPQAFAPPPCVCVPMVVIPAPILVPAQPVFAWGFAPPVGAGIYVRPGWVRPWGWGYARPFAFVRPGGRAFVR